MLDTKTLEEKRCEHLEMIKKQSYEDLMSLAEVDLSCSVHDAVAKVIKYGNCEDKACMLKHLTTYCFAENMISMPR